MRLVVITGMPGAGKSVAVAQASRLGLPVYSMGDRVRGEVQRRGLPLSPEVVGKTASAERERQGADVWAKRTLAVIPKRGGTAVVDGARSAAEIEAFRNQTAVEVVVLAVLGSPRTRAARLRRRGRSDDRLTARGFGERDRRELGWGIGEAIALADVVLVNEGTLAEFKAAATQVLATLSVGGASRPRSGSRAPRGPRPSARRESGKASRKRSRGQARGKTPPTPGRPRARRKSRP